MFGIWEARHRTEDQELLDQSAVSKYSSDRIAPAADDDLQLDTLCASLIMQRAQDLHSASGQAAHRGEVKNDVASAGSCRLICHASSPGAPCIFRSREDRQPVLAATAGMLPRLNSGGYPAISRRLVPQPQGSVCSPADHGFRDWQDHRLCFCCRRW